jgi:hypothetical protein
VGGRAGTGRIHLRKGQAIPPPASGGGRDAVYPWATMDIGDVFTVWNVKAASMLSQAWRAGIRLKRKFAVRRQPDGALNIYRVS